MDERRAARAGMTAGPEDGASEPARQIPQTLTGGGMIVDGEGIVLEMGFQEKNIYLSMEKKMYCGFGQCRHCVMGQYYACKDGPVFTYAQIKDEEDIWE